MDAPLSRLAPAAVALLVAVAFAGCGVETVQRSFDRPTIDQVGAGSIALKQIETAITDGALQATRAGKDKAADRLVSGELAHVTVADYARMAAENRGSRARFDRLMRGLGRIQTDARADAVDLHAHGNLTAGGKRFLRAWNAYLMANAARVSSVRELLGKLRWYFGAFDQLLAAGRSGSPARFDRLRHRFINRLVSSIRDFKTAGQRLSADTAADKRLLGLLNHDREARAIFDAVNHAYPRGFLADLARQNT
jgi:hypothetical protein